MAARNALSALLLSTDALPLEAIQKVFEEYGIELRCARSAEELDDLVQGRTLDLVVCDYDTPGVSTLACLGPETRWRGIAMVLLPNAKVREIQGKRVHFTIVKPATVDMLAKGLKAAYSTMAKRHCAAYRHSVALKPVSGTLLHHGLQRSLGPTVISNLSQTGLCLSGPEALPEGAVVTVQFALPDSDSLLHLVGTIVWSSASGKSGVRFQQLSPQEEKQLQDQLRERTPWNTDFPFRVK